MNARTLVEAVEMRVTTTGPGALVSAIDERGYAAGASNQQWADRKTPAIFRLPPGTYRILARSRDREAGREIVVTAREESHFAVQLELR